MNGKEIRYYEFGDFRLDTRRRRLNRRGEFVPITKRNFALLLFLVENSGQILEHDEILENVWDGLFVEQSNLKKGISALRRTLEESPDESYFIKTVPRRGYKFDAPVRELSDENDSADEIIFARQTNTEIIIEEEFEDSPGTDFAGSTIENAAALDSQTRNIQTKTHRPEIIVAVFAVLVLLIVAIGIKSYLAPTPIRFSAEKAILTKATTEGNLLGTYVSPDGNYIVYVVGERDSRNLRVKHLATGSVTELVRLAHAGLWCVNFSPDGNYIYYGVENFDDPATSGLYRIPFLGGESRRLFNEPVTDLTFSPDGRRMAFAHKLENLDAEIVTANLDGGEIKAIASYSTETHIDGLSWSPDNLGLLIALRKRLLTGKAISGVSEISLSNSEEKIIVPEQEKQITSPVWLPDKGSLLMSIRDENAEIYKIWQYFPSTGEWRRVVNDSNSYRLLSLTRDGKTLVSTREMRVASISTAESGQSDFRQITDGAGSYDHLVWTHDGRIVYDNSETGAATLWIMDADGTHKKQLTDGRDGIRLFPRISVDGNSIIFNSNRSGTQQLWRIGLDGESLSQLTNVASGTSGGTLLSDNQTLIYTSYIKPSGWTILKQTGDGRTVPLSTGESDLWSISPDGKFLAYASRTEQTKYRQVFICALKNGELIKTLDIEPKLELHWTHDGQNLAYVATKDDTDQIVIQPLDGRPPKTLLSFRSENIFQFDWSFETARLAVVRGKQLADALIIKTEPEK